MYELKIVFAFAVVCVVLWVVWTSDWSGKP